MTPSVSECRAIPCVVVVALLCIQGEAALALTKPTPEQAARQDAELEMFLCLDPCTWQDSDYANHSMPLDQINPEKLDTDQSLSWQIVLPVGLASGRR